MKTKCAARILSESEAIRRVSGDFFCASDAALASTNRLLSQGVLIRNRHKHPFQQ
jgi:hypothetical protein